mmetsp:Transcript_14613/g.33991  ORF Transcript_14613/g.33991 Transcript_14613/m.33991 type:complete len:105 (+) Transcript_14613:987-1301(+)
MCPFTSNDSSGNQTPICSSQPPPPQQKSFFCNRTITLMSSLRSLFQTLVSSLILISVIFVKSHQTFSRQFDGYFYFNWQRCNLFNITSQSRDQPIRNYILHKNL